MAALFIHVNFRLSSPHAVPAPRHSILQGPLLGHGRHLRPRLARALHHPPRALRVRRSLRRVAPQGIDRGAQSVPQLGARLARPRALPRARAAPPPARTAPRSWSCASTAGSLRRSRTRCPVARRRGPRALSWTGRMAACTRHCRRTSACICSQAEVARRSRSRSSRAWRVSSTGAKRCAHRVSRRRQGLRHADSYRWMRVSSPPQPPSFSMDRSPRACTLHAPPKENLTTRTTGRWTMASRAGRDRARCPALGGHPRRHRRCAFSSLACS
ncbi:hypothetical protein B0H10DRAFT_2007351 [Mycena sp. CBHHK59/15]|nr:hypothetical protein B0H10DRAFT_2007351 [Mycena sp. CBHHK59/15]